MDWWRLWVKGNDGEPAGPDGISPALAGAVALVVAAWAAVGVTGDALTRAVRNTPEPMAGVVLVALAAFGLPAIWLARRRPVVAVPLLLLLGAVSAGVWLGAMSVADREQPQVAVSAQSTASVTTLHVVAAGSGLKSREDMLVQAQALNVRLGDIDETELQKGCRNSRLFRSEPPDAPRWLGPVLLWEVSGPDAAGVVEVDTTIEMPHGEYAGVCVYVSLSSDDPSEGRAVVAYVETPELDFEDVEQTAAPAAP